MNIGTLTVSLGADVAGLDKATRAMNTTAQKWRTVGYLASATLTAPIVMAGKAAINLAKDYEYSMQKIVGLTGEAQSSVNKWNDEILKMGPEVARGPKELAEALYFISSSGIKGAEAMDVLKLSAKAATSGMGSTQDMANVLTSALNAYRGTGLTAAYATDVLVAAVREGKAEADGFASAMGQVIPIAAQLGVSFDQVAGGMAAITLTGSSAANASVYLKGIFNSLLKATTEGEKALNSIGLSYAVLRNILANQGLIPLMQKLRDIQIKYGDEILSDVLPNIRALTGYLSLAGKNFQYNTELMKRVTEATGSLGKAFAAVADTIKVRYDSAISAAQVSLISLGKSVAEVFLPILEKLVKRLEETTNWFNSLTDAQKQNKLAWVTFAAILGPASLLISIVIYALKGLYDGAMLASKGISWLTRMMLANPYLAAGAAILAIIGGLKIYADKVKEIAKAHDSFNTTLVKVNGTLQKLKDLTPADYGTMALEELKAAQIAVQQEWVKADKLYNQGVTNREGFSWFERLLGANKNNEKFMQDQVDKISTLKTLYEDLGEAIYEAWVKVKTDQETKRVLKLEESLKKLKATYESLTKKIEIKQPEFDPISGFKERQSSAWDAWSTKKGEISGLYSGNWEAQGKAIENYNNQLRKQTGIVSMLLDNYQKFFENVGGGFRGMLNSMIDALKEYLVKLAVLKIIEFTLNLLVPGSGSAVEATTNWRKAIKTPGYAGGTDYAQGGLSMVGERGPELVNLPRGSQVLPNNLLGAALRPAVIQGEVIFEIDGYKLKGILSKVDSRNSLY